MSLSQALLDLVSKDMSIEDIQHVVALAYSAGKLHGAQETKDSYSRTHSVGLTHQIRHTGGQ